MSAASFVFINGRVDAAEKARISVLDRGLLYGDGLLETLRCCEGEPFALELHLDRLRTSAAFFGITVPPTDWRRAIDLLLRRSRLQRGDAWLRITLTRGPGPRGLDPPVRPSPTLLMTAGKLDPAIAVRQRRGIRLVPVPFRRDPFLAAHKTLNYLPAILAKTCALETGADDALFTQGRRVLETTSANIFVWRGEELWTPRHGVLPGITRKLVIEAARADNVVVRQRSITLDDLAAAPEAFVTSSVAGVVPIVAVAGGAIGRGRRGPRTLRVQTACAQLWRR
jgi:branched-subunit amino acid aminotransferase/4-amino-4-deoxychorismate lyase